MGDAVTPLMTRALEILSGRHWIVKLARGGTYQPYLSEAKTFAALEARGLCRYREPGEVGYGGYMITQKGLRALASIQQPTKDDGYE